MSLTTDTSSDDPFVLVVDDTRAIRQVFLTFLKEQGVTCVAAEDGHHGWQIIKDAVPALVITDIEMPNWNGVRLIQEIRAASNEEVRRVPILACSSLTDAETIEQVVAAGADGFVVKPFALSELRDRISKLVALF